jgi:hypothetical protein
VPKEMMDEFVFNTLMTQQSSTQSTLNHDEYVHHSQTNWASIQILATQASKM